MKRILVLSLVLVFFSGLVMGWNIDVLDTEFDSVSEGEEYVGIVNITASGSDEPVKPSVLENDYNITYNHSGGEGELEWFRDGLWIAEFEYNDSFSEVNFTAEGGTDGTEPADQSDPVWDTVEISEGALNVTNFFDKEVNSGDQIDEMEANITGHREVVLEKQVSKQPNKVVEFDNGYVFLAEEDVLKMYDSDGNEYWNFTNHSEENNGNITALEVTGDFIYTGTEEGDLVKFDRSGITEGGTNSSGEWNKTFSNITSLAADGNGNIYVGDDGNNPLVKLESNGDTVWDDAMGSGSVAYDLEVLDGDVVAVRGSGGSGDNVTLFPGDGSSSEWTYTGHSGNPVGVEVFNGDVYSFESGEVHMIEPGDGEIDSSESTSIGLSGDVQATGVFSRGVLAGGSSGDVKALSSDMDTLWEFDSHSTGVEDFGYGNSSIVSVDDGGNIYRSDRSDKILSELGAIEYVFWNETGSDRGNLEALSTEEHSLDDSQDVQVPESEDGIILTLKANYTSDHFSGLEGSDSIFLDFDSSSGDTFELGDDIEMDVDFNGNYTETLEVNSSIDEQLNLTTNVSDDLEGIVDLNKTVEIEDGGAVDMDINITVDSVDDVSGTIDFEDNDTDFSSSVDVDLDEPEYNVRNDTLAALTSSSGEIDEVVDEETENISIDLYYFGENLTGENDTVEVDTSVTGNVSNHVSVDDFEMNNSKEVDIEFSPESEGNFTGDIEFSTDDAELSINTSLESEVSEQETGISLPFSFDLGAVGEGFSKTGELEVDNTGDVDFEGLEFESEDFNVSGENVSISAGETETVEVEFESVDTESGSLEVTGVISGMDNVEESVSVSFDVLDDFDQRITDIEDELNSLSGNAEDSQQTRIEDLRVQKQNAQTAYDSEDWDEALEELEAAEEEVETLSQEIESSSSSDPGTGTDTSSQGGGLPILPIGIILVLLLGGFLAWSSIIPEEGDPLYEVLG